jgi:hypothetical protein
MASRFKLDENLPNAAEVLLKQGGFDVETVLTEHLGGCTDAELFEKCRAKVESWSLWISTSPISVITRPATPMVSG